MVRSYEEAFRQLAAHSTVVTYTEPVALYAFFDSALVEFEKSNSR
jgi:hypothetical protein